MSGSGPCVLLFTDTLGDVNGVSRFIRSIGECALDTGRNLRIITSTNFPVPRARNISNFPPLAAMRMPKYENLELALPPAGAVMREARRLRPDAVHVSTPGPVGLLGRHLARRLSVPLLGTYHTDFPAYIERLFCNESLALGCRGFMRWFYAPFARLFSRSDEYIETMSGLGIPRDRCLRLRPGIVLESFQPRYRDDAALSRLCGSPPGTVRVLYAGRVSVEKGLPLLAEAWRIADAALHSRKFHAELVIVGDGPYRAAMEELLRGTRTVFLGFRHAEELSMIYAGCDLFAFPSTTDTLGQVVMEAMSSGLPVLVTDIGGPRELVRDEQTGHVLSARDSQRWAAEITRLVTDSDRRTRMGRAAHESVQPRSIQRSFDEFWDAHTSLLGNLRDRHGVSPA